MTELGGLALLLGGLSALAATGALAAACLRLRSPIEFLLAAYLIAWTWLILSSFVLSPAELLTRGAFVLALGAGAVLALGIWLATGRPTAPDFGKARAQVRDALRDPAVLVLAVAVLLGAVYIGALAFLTPPNDWDALSYHLARADFWKQDHGVGYIANTPDSRLNVNPPNAEIGQLATMLLAGNDRYVPLAQLSAYAALILGVVGLGARIGLGACERVFGGLAFATLPLLVLQAPGALNDLVVASFLAAAAFFALGAGRSPLVLVALAVGLAIGTKFTGLLALPTLGFVAAFGRPVRQWPALLAAAIAGLAAGSVWYVVNLVETGHLDGNAAQEFDQQAGRPGTVTVVSAMRLTLSFVDMAGAPWRISLLFLVGACALAGGGLLLIRRSRTQGTALLLSAALTTAVIALPLIQKAGVRVVYKTGLLLDTPLEFLDLVDWQLNTRAEPTLAWYGPLGLLVLAAGAAVVFMAWRRQLPALALALAVAPLLLVVTVALSLTWDPWRGRFLVFGVALSAATWGLLLRSKAAATATAVIGATALFLALANHQSKPSGLFSKPSIWAAEHWEAQSTLSGPREIYRFVEENIPANARLGLSLPGTHLIHPYFGSELSRHVSLVGMRSRAPAQAEWLVLAPGTAVRRCADAWKPGLVHQGWTVERRVGPDACLNR